jgi:hypothetical protein
LYRSAQREEVHKNNMVEAIVFMSKIDAARPNPGIPRRSRRHANVGIALACCICLNKPVRSRQDLG